MSRERKILVALGAPGMGKSTLIHLLVDNYPAAAGTIRALDPGHQFEWGEWCGSGRASIGEWISDITGLDSEGRDIPGATPHRGLVILDDCDRFIEPAAWRMWKDMFVANRHLQLDLAVSAHRPQGVPKELLGCATELWLFAQEEPLALDYLSKISTLRGTLRGSRLQLPTEPGLALRVVPREKRVALVKLFEADGDAEEETS